MTADPSAAAHAPREIEDAPPEIDGAGPETEHVAHHLCPVWAGRLLASPLRALIERPRSLLAPHVRPGMRVLDLGCAMGFFTLHLAALVGPRGRVVAIDVQEPMLAGLRSRVRRRRLEAIVEPRLATQDDLGVDDLAGTVDFALAYHTVHETRYPERFLRSCRAALRPGARLLLAEPVGHVTDDDFEGTLRLARRLGFVQVGRRSTRRNRIVLLETPRTDGGRDTR